MHIEVRGMDVEDVLLVLDCLPVIPSGFSHSHRPYLSRSMRIYSSLGGSNGGTATG